MLVSLAFNALETAGTIVWATVKQRHVPAAMLGRVSSLDWLISIGLLPLSFALTGPVSAAIGVRETLVAAGVLGAVVDARRAARPGRAGDRGPRAGPGAGITASAHRRWRAPYPEEGDDPRPDHRSRPRPPRRGARRAAAALRARGAARAALRRRRARRPDRAGRRPTSTRARSCSPRGGAGDDWFCFEQPDRDARRARDARAAWRGSSRRRTRDALRPPSPRRWRAPGRARRGRHARRAGRRGARRRRRLPVRAGRRRRAALGAASGRAASSCPRSPSRGAARDVRLTVAALADADDVPEELWRASSAGSRGCATCRSRCSTRRRPGASGSPRRRRPSTTRRPSPAPWSGSARARSRRSCWPARSPCTRRRRTTPPRCSACCAPASAPASCTAPAAATPRSSARRPSCWSAARACAPRRWRWPARRAARPIPPSTRISASSCCSRARTARSRTIVTRRIARALRPLSVWVAAPDEPAIVRVANIQHLATPIRAQLTHPRSVVDLAGLLHPTPAVGAEPHAVATPQIPAFEGLDRGWYAGPVGWTDANDDGEFCVALRCALLRGSRGAALRRRGRGARLRPRGRAGRDRGQARRAPAGPQRLERAACATPRAPPARSPCGRRCASPAGARRARSAPSRAARARSRARGTAGPSCRRARCRRRRSPSTSGAPGGRGLAGDLHQPFLRHGPGTLDGGPDGLPDRAVQRDVLRPVGADVDERRARARRAPRRAPRGTARARRRATCAAP